VINSIYFLYTNIIILPRDWRKRRGSACAELAWTTDPEKQKALLKECPKGLPEGYKPSQKKSW
jgi:hypothetical protein